MEEMVTNDIITDLKNENEVLKLRCFVFSDGVMCDKCLLKCIHKEEQLKEGISNDH